MRRHVLITPNTEPLFQRSLVHILADGELTLFHSGAQRGCSALCAYGDLVKVTITNIIDGQSRMDLSAIPRWLSYFWKLSQVRCLPACMQNQPFVRACLGGNRRLVPGARTVHCLRLQGKNPRDFLKFLSMSCRPASPRCTLQYQPSPAEQHGSTLPVHYSLVAF